MIHGGKVFNQKKFGSKNYFDKQFLGPKEDQTKFWSSKLQVKKNFGQNKFVSKKIWLKNFLGQKFWVRESLRSNQIWSKKIRGPNKFRF